MDLEVSVIHVLDVQKMVAIMLEGNVTPSLHVQETALFHVEGECDPCAVC
jgi:hypothetical protein